MIVPVKISFSTKLPLQINPPTGFSTINGDPYLYVLCESESARPIYIGEYGKANTYNVLDRIKKHFSSCSSSTLNRVYKNMKAYKHPIPKKIDAYIFSLPEQYKDPAPRQSLEAWIIHKLCHEKKLNDPRFCVTKFSAPTSPYSAEAESICAYFEHKHLTLRSSGTVALSRAPLSP